MDSCGQVSRRERTAMRIYGRGLYGVVVGGLGLLSFPTIMMRTNGFSAVM